MTEIVILVAALLPAALLWWYVRRMDPIKEPRSWLWRALICGAAISVPVCLVELFISAVLFGGGEPTNIFGTTFEAFLVAALPEESFKLLALWLVLRKNPFYDEHYDGIVYAVSVSLGFAAVENVLFLFENMDDWQSIALMRALLAVPGHYAFGVLMGYYYSLYHFGQRTPNVRLMVLMAPVLAHGCYDALALSGQVDVVAGGLSFIILIFFCIKMHKMAKRNIYAHLEKDYRDYNERLKNEAGEA